VVSVTERAYLAFLVLLAAERLFELRLSHRNARASFARGGVEVGRAHYRVMTALHTAFLLCCALEVVGWRRPFPGALGVLALLGALASQGLRYWAIATLGARWNTRVIFVPDERPVVAGPYRWVRHPNYVAVIAEIALVPLVHGAWVTAVAFTIANAALLAVRIRTEERALGGSYAVAFAGRPRFIPGTSAHRG
jgi:methyltransferase